MVVQNILKDFWDITIINSEEISKSDCKILSTRIRDDIYTPVYTLKTTIFLCGAEYTQTDKLRYIIAKALSGWRYAFQYDIIYPESFFEELLYSSKAKDLLSLENLLAESVDAVVLIPESPGSFAELGAFANNEKLREKLICIVDKKYKKDKSFINQGPIKLVKKTNRHNLIYVDPNNIKNEIGKLSFSLKQMKNNGNKISDRITLLQLDSFLLPAIFLLEPVTKNLLINLVGYAIEDEKNSFQATTAALTVLTKKKQVELTTNGYKLTTLGVKTFLSFRRFRSREKNQDKTIKIDNLRLEILNLKYRKKRLKV